MFYGIDVGGYSSPAFAGLDANGTSTPIETTIWHTSINTTGSYTFDFHAYRGAVFEIRDTKVRNCGSGLFGSSGMRISTDNTTIMGNIFEENNLGIYLDGAADAIIIDNTFFNNTAGIHADEAVRITIRNNNFSFNIRNIQFVNTTNSIISSNFIGSGEMGISLNFSSDNTLEKNSISNSSTGIYLLNSYKNKIRDNDLEACERGIRLENAIEINLTGNVFLGCGVLIKGNDVEDFASHNLKNNTVNNAPLYYFSNVAGIQVPKDAGGIIMANCSEMKVEGIDISSADVGIELAYVNDSHITDNNLLTNNYGLFLHASNSNIISENNLTGNGIGIYLIGQSSNNSIHFNDISTNEGTGLNASENGGIIVDAVKNFWGDSSGPYHPVNNSEGKGNTITDYVLFKPWLRAPPGENIWYVNASALVGGNGSQENPFNKIQDAVDNASRGETILVLPGIYRENLVVSRDIDIQGRFGNVILDAGEGKGIHIKARTTIANFTFINSSADLELEVDVTIYNTSVSSVNFIGKCNLSVGYYLNVVTMDVNGKPIQGAELIIENNFPWKTSYFSNAGGIVKDIAVIEYIQNSTTKTQLNPHYLNASYDYGYDNATLYIDSNSQIILNLSRHGAFGTGVVCGDLDGDDLEDYVVGAPFESTEGWNSGAVFIFSGNSSFNKKEIKAEDADLIINGESPKDYFGTALCIDDFNRDGKDDLVVSAPGHQGGKGTVYLFSGELFESGTPAPEIEDAVLLTSMGSSLGNTLITGDADYDSYPDILAGNDIGVTVFHGQDDMSTPLQQSTFYGLSQPALVNFDEEDSLAAIVNGMVRVFPLAADERLLVNYDQSDDFQGTFNKTWFNDGLTLYPYHMIPILPNADFDNGWENWTNTTNIRNKNDGQWELTTEEHGDWKVYDGATASLGPVGYDYVATANNAGRYSNGKLVSEPFLVPSDIRYFDFWCHVKWWSYERANEGNQDEIPDAVIFRLVDESSGSVVAEKVYNQTEYDYDGEVQGRQQFDISDHQGEWLRFEMEHVTNRIEYDDGLIQVDNITGRNNPEMRGNFTSDFMNFNMSISYLTVHWEEELNGGNITLYYRTDESGDWSPMGKDELMEINTTNATSFQYQVELEGAKGEPYPVLKGLYFNFYNFTPESLGKGSPYDGGQIFGNSTLVIVDNAKAALYNGTSAAFTITSEEDIDELTSIGDVDGNGISDLLISSNNSVYLIPMNRTSGDLELEKAPYSFTGSKGFGLFLNRNLVGSPLEHRRDGRVYLLPTHLNDTAILGVDIENHSLVHPDSGISLNLSLLNMGLNDMDSLDIVMNITGEGGYNFENIQRISIDSWESAEVKFDWHVPDEEGTNYTLRFGLPPDHDNSNNFFSLDIRAHYHALTLSSPKDYDAVRPGGILRFSLEVENKGTFGPDNISFETELPENWSWWIRKNATNITHLIVGQKENIELFIFANSSLGEYPMVFRVISENGWTTAAMNLKGHLVERDLMPVGARFIREDGKEAEPVAGENTTIMLEIKNYALQNAGFFDVSLELDGTPHQLENAGELAGNSSIHINFTLSFTGGAHTLTFVVDVEDAVKEYNENNNILTIPVEVREEIASTPFVFRIEVKDLSGANVTNITVSARSGESEVTNVTDSHGNTTITLIDSYREGSIYLVEATMEELYGAVKVRVYSEDGITEITLVVGRYSILLNCYDRDKDILPDGNQNFIIYLENTGDFDDSYGITLRDLPEDWAINISGSGVENGTIFLEKGDSTAFTLDITAWRYAPAHERSEIVVTVSSVIAPMSKREVLIRLTTLAVENISLFTDNPEGEGSPGDLISHGITIRNEGNTIRTITIIVIGDLGYSFLNEKEFTLFPGENDYLLFFIDIPTLREGTVLHHEVCGVVTGVGLTNTLNFTTTIQTYTNLDRIEITIEDSTLHVINKGNILENLTIGATMEFGYIILDLTTLELDMEEEIEISFDVQMMNMDVPSGSEVDVSISIYNGKMWFNSTLPLEVPPVHNFLLIPESTHLNAVPGTNAEFKIVVKNTGNTQENIIFRRTNSGDEPIHIPSPLTLERNSEQYISIHMPILDYAEGTRHITLTGIAGNKEVTINITLNIYANRDLELSEISVRPHEGGAKYTINLYNNGEIDEIVEIEANCGELDLQTTQVNPGEFIQFHLMIPMDHICPESINLNAISNTAEGVNATLTLNPPPIAEIQILSPVPVTVLGPVILTATGSYQSYKWAVDSRIISGKEISYRFTTSGTHIIQLTVMDNRDLSCTGVLEVHVENLPPRINTKLFLFGTEGEYIEFDSGETRDLDGTITAYSWAIGNTTYHGDRIYQLFEKDGVYNINFTVTDNQGASNSTTIQLTVVDSTASDQQESEKEKINMNIVVFSIMFIFLVIGVFVYVFVHMGHKETSLLCKLDEMEKMKTLEGKETPSDSEKKVPGEFDKEARICGKCEANVPRYFRFCNKCGSTLEKEDEKPAEEGKSKVCSECGAHVPGYLDFCNICGVTMGKKEGGN